MRARQLRSACVLGAYLCFLAATPLAAQAAPGELDASFGTDGKVTTTITGADAAEAVVVQSDGKIVVAGQCGGSAPPDFCLARYNEDGSLDTSFDADGKVITAIGTLGDAAYAVTIQGDGHIIAAGYCRVGSTEDFCLARYNSDGSLDTSFDTDGKVTTAVGTANDFVQSLAVQSDGKIVAGGDCRILVTPPSTWDFCLARYHPDGSLDTSFDTDGIVTTGVEAGDDNARAVAVQSDGKIIAAGGCGAMTDFCVARYNSDGSLDTSFDTDGKVTTAVGTGTDFARGMVLQSDGKIVVAGSCRIDSTEDFCLARYNGDGSLDISFDTDGKVTTAIGTGIDVAQAVAIQGDGKIVAAGFCRLDLTEHFCLARYNGDGSLDSPFGSGGMVTTVIDTGGDDARAVTVQADGKIVAAGSCPPQLCLARYDNLPVGSAGLTVKKSGTGFGRITGPGVDCGSDCFEPYATGTPVTLTAAVSAGSAFGGWSGCDSTNATSCTVTMSATRAVTVTFTATPTFADVPPSNPFYTFIERLFDLNITTGCGTNGSGDLIFCPGDPVPRQQMAAFLIRAKGLTQLFSPTPTFADVPTSNPFYGYIERLFEQGITTGCGTNASGDLIYCPGDFVPRQQMAAFLIRAKGLTQLFSPTPTFADVPTSNPFYGYIERLFEQAITTGCGTNAGGQRIYCPVDNVPRQQMAAFLVRAFDT